MEKQPKNLPSASVEFNCELEAYRYLKGMGLPGVVFKPSRMGDSHLDSTPFLEGTEATS